MEPTKLDSELDSLESHLRTINKYITGDLPFDEVRFGTLWSQVMSLYGVQVGDQELMIKSRGPFGHTINDWISYGKDYFKSVGV